MVSNQVTSKISLMFQIMRKDETYCRKFMVELFYVENMLIHTGLPISSLTVLILKLIMLLIILKLIMLLIIFRFFYIRFSRFFNALSCNFGVSNNSVYLKYNIGSSLYKNVFAGELKLLLMVYSNLI